MKKGFLVAALPFVFLLAYCQDRETLKYKPVNLEDAVSHLAIIHDDTIKAKIRAMSENEFLAGSHFGLGMWIRNNWGLWRGKELAKYLNSIGLFHPDDMSSVILTCYYRELTGRAWELDEQIKYYRDYWQKSQEHANQMETDTAYRHKVQMRHDSIGRAQLQTKKNEWTAGKKVVGYLEYQCGILPAGRRAKVTGTIIEWRNDDLLIQIDSYADEKKKEKVIKCNQIVNDIVLVVQHHYFSILK
ncbi:MAG: DUF6794 domain-containing protein [Cyclobacteriaceae bacterium]